jgi:hypothetical protein
MPKPVVKTSDGRAVYEGLRGRALPTKRVDSRAKKFGAAIVTRRGRRG